jgi:hypothetical protein
MRKREYSPHHGSLPRFDRNLRAAAGRFTYIGSGELGGKAHGLARVQGVLDSKLKGAFAPDITVSIPSLTVITTDSFDLFMKQNGLGEVAWELGDRAKALAIHLQERAVAEALVAEGDGRDGRGHAAAPGLGPASRRE